MKSIILVLLSLMMSITIALDHLVSSREKNNEDVALEASIFKDKDLSEAEEVASTWKNLSVKRGLSALKFPSDCKSDTLRSFAKKCGLDVQPGGSHWKVYDGEKLVTVIPHSVKQNGTCKSIINALNNRCK